MVVFSRESTSLPVLSVRLEGAGQNEERSSLCFPCLILGLLCPSLYERLKRAIF